jgi:hypothetical protein
MPPKKSTAVGSFAKLLLLPSFLPSLLSSPIYSCCTNFGSRGGQKTLDCTMASQVVKKRITMNAQEGKAFASKEITFMCMAM